MKDHDGEHFFERVRLVRSSDLIVSILGISVCGIGGDIIRFVSEHVFEI